MRASLTASPSHHAGDASAAATAFLVARVQQHLSVDECISLGANVGFAGVSHAELVAAAQSRDAALALARRVHAQHASDGEYGGVIALTRRAVGNRACAPRHSPRPPPPSLQGRSAVRG